MFDPTPGLVVRYDYLWRREADRGQLHGRKDRPAAVMVVLPATAGKERHVLLCAITHSEPSEGLGVLIPPRVRAHLGLDDQPCWIITTEYNVVPWPKGMLPYGVGPATPDRETFGLLPPKLYNRVIDQLQTHATSQKLSKVKRD